jgi:hypothetical protein
MFGWQKEAVGAGISLLPPENREMLTDEREIRFSPHGLQGLVNCAVSR